MFFYRLHKKPNTEIDDAEDIDVVMPMYNLIEYSDNNYSKRTGTLWLFYRDELTLDIMVLLILLIIITSDTF